MGDRQWPGTSVSEDEAIWQDREIRFDMPPELLDPRRGEIRIDAINNIEDTKGNNGDRGMLIITNLRFIWLSHKSSRTNLSIGYNCVLSINIRTANSKIRGNAQALFVLAKHTSRFEFIFTNLVKGSPRLFTTVQSVHRAYETSRLYRDLKLRGAIVREKTLILLPQERIISRINGVWNLSSEQGNLGTFIVTNARVVWFANLAENFNVSIPYLQMKQIRVRQSKFGPALVIETTAVSGGFILGFHMQPEDKLQEVTQEIVQMHKVYSASPLFGVDYVTEEKAQPTVTPAMPRVQDDVQIVETGGGGHEAYFADLNKTTDRRPVFNVALGLAVEELPEGLTVDRLWQGGLL
eukprot:TRINITY_DN2020_c0_g1_i1.p1 TRINITY_DN2020_c0_g1~~TRINITY_DN2020_c0_g1_i1.p1  ORF type:complete len:351 (-),score=66.28 TRINITY_DN2020_c0_g1_i1:1493-2545(-)